MSVYLETFERIGKLPGIQSLTVHGGERDEELSFIFQRVHVHTDQCFIPSSIGQLERLKVLKLQNITIIPSEIRRLTSLERLEVSASSPKEIAFPQVLGKLKSLRTLKVTNVKAWESLAFIGELGFLKKLEFAMPLYELPPSICSLSELTHLNLSGCKLVKLPPQIRCLYALTHLWLDKNELTEIPGSIGELKNLVVLDLSYTDVGHLPDSICYLEKLKVLRICPCKITALPSDMGRLTSLEELAVGSKKHFTKHPVPAPLYYKLINQPFLEETIFPQNMMNLTSLTSLSMIGIGLTTVPSFIASLTQLKYLDLSHNQLGKYSLIEEIACWASSPLEYLGLYKHENLIFSEELQRLRTLQYVILEGNQLKCYPNQLKSSDIYII